MMHTPGGYCLGAEFFLEQIVDLRRIGLALRDLHRLADEIANSAFLPARRSRGYTHQACQLYKPATVYL